MVKNVAEAATGEPWQADFGLTPDGAKGLRLSMLGVPGTQVFTGIGLGNPPTEKVPVVIARRKAKESIFVSLLEPFSSPATRHPSRAIRLSSVAITGGDGVAVEMESEGRKVAALVSSAPGEKSCDNGLSTDGQAAFLLWRDGQLIESALIEGKLLRWRGDRVPTAARGSAGF